MFVTLVILIRTGGTRNLNEPCVVSFVSPWRHLLMGLKNFLRRGGGAAANPWPLYCSLNDVTGYQWYPHT